MTLLTAVVLLVVVLEMASLAFFPEHSLQESHSPCVGRQWTGPDRRTLWRHSSSVTCGSRVTFALKYELVEIKLGLFARN